MILITHISLAILSLVSTGYLYYAPSKSKFITTYALTALSFATGFYLVWGKPSHMIEACIVGFVYFAVIMLGIFGSKHKLKQIQTVPEKKS